MHLEVGRALYPGVERVAIPNPNPNPNPNPSALTPVYSELRSIFRGVPRVRITQPSSFWPMQPSPSVSKVAKVPSWLG